MNGINTTVRIGLIKQARIQLPTSAVNAARHAFRCWLLWRRSCWAPGSNRLASPAFRAQICNCSVQKWDEWTDRRTPDRYIDPAPHSMRAVPIRACNSRREVKQSSMCSASISCDWSLIRYINPVLLLLLLLTVNQTQLASKQFIPATDLHHYKQQLNTNIC